MHKAFKFRLYPTKEQIVLINKTMVKSILSISERVLNFPMGSELTADVVKKNYDAVLKAKEMFLVGGEKVGN